MDESEVLKFEQPAKVLKLSEAIRIGCLLRPKQCVGVFGLGNLSSCAIGAAYEAITGMDPSNGVPMAWTNECLDANVAYAKRYGMSPYRDNDSGTTREAIADRLEALGY